jgi:hypothetical protein
MVVRGRILAHAIRRTTARWRLPSMSTVVAFNKPKASPPKDIRTYGPAQVLLFTGVRYERLEIRPTVPAAETSAVQPSQQQ